MLSRHGVSCRPFLAASSALCSRRLHSETISYLILARVLGRRRLGQYRRIRSSAPLIFLAIDRISLFIRRSPFPILKRNGARFRATLCPRYSISGIMM
jgi:hypothetical protein